MKWQCILIGQGFKIVAPLAGAWIEISVIVYIPINPLVAPLAGAWIEM